ncbi:homocysteine-responsive endoplasmic reticulum-resident ubiquitin-like domain member 2 protein [Leptopilina boulardi]|uniref:homocysteine-responsive endoplasmic reticulum-resident ubiquitin-like domain member 2 protein n=1 Tax=Leptopilina boulardi TaxID=63433 RepID=UPI0021F60643|nr:homocysteine-responsive endoplasmic reticulum-resident ubiquitin-like domain member 2 protein [Leptopilina boulardi]
MESAGVRLIIKAPNQQIEDQIIICELGWTIRKLKDYLAEVYPSKPETKDQKLIYSGQLLNDSACLKDVLRHYEDTEDQPFTVHLVCPTDKMGFENKIDKSNESKNTLNSERNLEQNRFDSVGQGTVNTQPTAQTFPMQSFYGQLNSQQIAWMQQAYTHYLTQYMQLMAAQGVQVPNSIPYIQRMNLNSNNLGNNNTNGNNVNQNEEVEQPRQVPQDNADAGAGDDAAAALNRDWLDLFYMLSRIVVLLAIVYFYSSPIRFLIVAFLGFAMYLYSSGFFRVQPVLMPENNNARPEENNPRPENNNPQNDEQQPGVQQDNGQEIRAETNERTNLINEENETERPGALAFTWSFFSSFFASLIPDQPNVL